jgi:hypothetical protein
MSRRHIIMRGLYDRWTLIRGLGRGKTRRDWEGREWARITWNSISGSAVHNLDSVTKILVLLSGHFNTYSIWLGINIFSWSRSYPTKTVSRIQSGVERGFLPSISGAYGLPVEQP